MEPFNARRVGTLAVAAIVLLLLACSAAFALEPKDSGSYLDQKAFFKPELYISSSQEPIERIINRLPNQAVWQRYLEEQEIRQATGVSSIRSFSRVYIDPRS